MAELEPAVKNRISHRGRALGGAMPILQRLAGQPVESLPPPAS
jgi:inosine/xanthosine triphosphate pyrophosphatase family protein